MANQVTAAEFGELVSNLVKNAVAHGAKTHVEVIRQLAPYLDIMDRVDETIARQVSSSSDDVNDINHFWHAFRGILAGCRENVCDLGDFEDLDAWLNDYGIGDSEGMYLEELLREELKKQTKDPD